MKSLRVITLLSPATVLLACGFHLQGHAPLPASMRTPYVQASDRQSDFVQSLRKAMLIAGARPVERKERASAVVNVMRDQVQRRVLSVSANNQPDEYEVTYLVRFSVSSADKELLPPQDVSATRSYSFDESLLLAKEHEEEILRQAMAHDLADIVMRQLSSLPSG
ncbi:MAG TPA: LPS assembly lipoprotein LptE [Steroidobacteraceae bacterium]